MFQKIVRSSFKYLLLAFGSGFVAIGHGMGWADVVAAEAEGASVAP